MTLQINCEQSNKADWTLQVSATDSDSGDAINFTGANVDLKIKDENNCLKLEASTINGKVTSPSIGVLQFAFTSADMACLCPATYQIGAVYSLNGATFQLFVGSLAIYDGVASL